MPNPYEGIADYIDEPPQPAATNPYEGIADFVDEEPAAPAPSTWQKPFQDFAKNLLPQQQAPAPQNVGYIQGGAPQSQMSEFTPTQRLQTAFPQPELNYTPPRSGPSRQEEDEQLAQYEAEQILGKHLDQKAFDAMEVPTQSGLMDDIRKEQAQLEAVEEQDAVTNYIEAMRRLGRPVDEAGLTKYLAQFKEMRQKMRAAKGQGEFDRNLDQIVSSKRREFLEGIPGPAPVRNVVTGVGEFGLGALSGLQRVTGLGDADETNRAKSDYDRQAAELDKESDLPEWMNRTIRGGAQSLAQSIAFAPAGALGVIGGGALMRYNEALTEGKDAGLEGVKLDDYAERAGLIEGGITAAFQKFGVGGLEAKILGKEVVKQGLGAASKQFGKSVLAELTEENMIAISDLVNQQLSGVKPDALTYANVTQAITDATLQTLAMTGTAHAPTIASNAKQWAAENPGKIAEFLLGKGSRKDFENAGITAKMSAAERVEFMEQVAQVKDVTPEGDGAVPPIPGAEVNDTKPFAGPVDEVASQQEAAEDLARKVPLQEQPFDVAPLDNSQAVENPADLKPNPEAKSDPTGSEFVTPAQPATEAAKPNKSAIEKAFWEDQRGALQKRMDGDDSVRIVNRHDVSERIEGQYADRRIFELAFERAKKSDEKLVYIASDLIALGGLNKRFGKSGANVHFAAMSKIRDAEFNARLKEYVGTNHGGDEFGDTVLGAPIEVVNEAIAAAKTKIAAYTKEHGLDDVVSDKGGSITKGTGLNFYAVQFDPSKHKVYTDVIDHAEKQLEIQKELQKKGKQNVIGESPASLRPATPEGQAGGATEGAAGASPEVRKPVGKGKAKRPASPEGQVAPAPEVKKGKKLNKPKALRVYHGSSSENIESIIKTGFDFKKSGDSGVADAFKGVFFNKSGRDKMPGAFVEANISPKKIKHFDTPDELKDFAQTVTGKTYEAVTKSDDGADILTRLLRSQGYDAITFGTKFDTELGNGTPYHSDFVQIIDPQAIKELKRGDKPAKGKALQKPEPTPLNDDTPAADDIAREADDSPQAESMGSMGGNLFGGRQVLREDAVPEVAKAPDKAVEARLAAAKGAKPEPVKGKIKDLAVAAYNKMTRANEFLPNDAAHAVDNEVLRLIQEVPAAAQDEVNRQVASIIDPMGKEQAKIFSRHAVMSNLVRSVKNGEPLRFGFKSLSEAEAYLDTLQEAVEQVPEIKKAIENRKRIVGDTVKELKDNGLLPPDTEADDYYHQQVLERMQAASYDQRSAKMKRRAFQKGRFKSKDVTELGAEYDYNTDYIEAETRWMTDARTLLMQKKLMDKLDKERGWHPKDDSDQIPDTHEVWAAAPGNALHQALSIPEQVAEQVQKTVLDESALSPDGKEAARILAGQRLYVFPKELVQQLNAMEKAKPAGAWGKLWHDALASWKWWQLNRPNNIIEYQVRNITGDLDAAINIGPGLAKYTVSAVDEIASYYSGKKIGVSPDMKAARDLGVIGASEAEADQPKIKDLPLFKRFYRDPAHARMSFFDGVNRFQAFREGVLRYAAFKYFRDQLNAKTLNNYGGAKKEVIDNLVKTMGVDVAAAHLSRNLIGDYGNITHFGKWMRRNFAPFWSYAEINLKRYPQLIKNAFKAKGWTGAGKAAIPGAALLTTTALMKMGALYTITHVINKLRAPDEEEDLSANTKRSAHINLGRNPDGTVRVFRNVGASGDFLEWFGISTLISLYPKYKAGQLTAGDIIKEMAKDPIDKVARSGRPDVKAGLELATGYSLFPSIFNPRQIRRDEVLPGALGLTQEYRAARGAAMKDGTRAAPNYLQNWLWSTENPEKNALGEMYDLRARFLTKEGRDVPDFKGLKTSFGVMKDAAGNGDYKAFKEALRLYREKADAKKFIQRIDSLDPIEDGLNDADEKKFENEFLTAPQRMKLKIVRDYAQQLKIDMYQMYKQAAEEEGGDMLKDFEKASTEKIKNLKQTLRGKAPQKVAKEDRESGGGYPATLERWRKGKAKAKVGLEAMGQR